MSARAHLLVSAAQHRARVAILSCVAFLRVHRTSRLISLARLRAHVYLYARVASDVYIAPHGSAASHVTAPAAVGTHGPYPRVRILPHGSPKSCVTAWLQSLRVRRVCACSSARQRRTSPRPLRFFGCSLRVFIAPHGSSASRTALASPFLRASRLRMYISPHGSSASRVSPARYARAFSARAHLASRPISVGRHRAASICTRAPCLRVLFCSSAPRVSAPAAIRTRSPCLLHGSSASCVTGPASICSHVPYLHAFAAS